MCVWSGKRKRKRRLFNPKELSSTESVTDGSANIKNLHRQTDFWNWRRNGVPPWGRFKRIYMDEEH